MLLNIFLKQIHCLLPLHSSFQWKLMLTKHECMYNLFFSILMHFAVESMFSWANPVFVYVLAIYAAWRYATPFSSHCHWAQSIVRSSDLSAVCCRRRCRKLYYIFIFFSRTAGPISTKLCTKDHLMKGINVCLNLSPNLLVFKKIFFSKSTQQEKLEIVRKHHQVV